MKVALKEAQYFVTSPLELNAELREYWLSYRLNRWPDFDDFYVKIDRFALNSLTHAKYDTD